MVDPTVLLSHLAAPSLTLENVLPVVKGVRSWRTLAKHLVYAYDPEDGGVPPLMPGTVDLDDFQHQHGSDEDCLKVVVEKFLLGEGQYSQPSWRAVIWSLYNANEIQLAEHIRCYAEPLQGVCMCMYA